MNFKTLVQQLLKEPDQVAASLQSLHQSPLDSRLVAEFIAALNPPSPRPKKQMGLHELLETDPGTKIALAERLGTNFPIVVTAKKTPPSSVAVSHFVPEVKALEHLFVPLHSPHLLDYSRPWLSAVPWRAQVVSVSSVEAGDLVAEVAARLNTPTLALHNTTKESFGASSEGATRFWIGGVGDAKVHSGAFFAEDYDFKSGETSTALDLNEAVVGEFFASLL